MRTRSHLGLAELLPDLLFLALFLLLLLLSLFFPFFFQFSFQLFCFEFLGGIVIRLDSLFE